MSIDWNFTNEQGTELNKYIMQVIDALGTVTDEVTIKLLRDATITTPGTPLTAEKLNEIITNINNILVTELPKKVDKLINLSNGINVNTVLASGFYKLPTTVVNGSLGASGGNMLVIDGKQIIIQTDKKMFYRVGTSDPWHEVAIDMPAWTKTANKPTYTAGEVGAITPAGVDTKIADVKIGGRNLVLGSGVFVKNASYPTKTYTLSSLLLAGQTYTISIKGKLAPTRNNWLVTYNGGVELGYVYDVFDGVFVRTFVAPTTSTNNIIAIYATPGNTDENEIEWIKLERGNKATDWTPAPEDLIAKSDLVDTNGVVQVDKIPGLPGDKITSGVIGIGRIPNIPNSKLTEMQDFIDAVNDIPATMPNPYPLKINYRGQSYTYDGSVNSDYTFDFDHTHNEEDMILSIVEESGATFESSAYPKGKTVYISHTSLSQFTVRPDGYGGVTHAKGTEISIIRRGLGEVEIVPATGVTVLSHDNNRFINGQHQAVMLIKDAPNQWLLIGALKP